QLICGPIANRRRPHFHFGERLGIRDKARRLAPFDRVCSHCRPMSCTMASYTSAACWPAWRGAMQAGQECRRVAKFTQNEVWADTLKLTRTHWAALIAIAGVFNFLPTLLVNHFFPMGDPPVDADLQTHFQFILDYYRQN